MTTQENFNDFVNVIMQQRNEALNRLAEATAVNLSLQKQLNQESENAKNDENTTD